MHIQTATTRRTTVLSHASDRTHKISSANESSSAASNGKIETASVRKKPAEFGKGRLERSKQISHLGLFPQPETKQIQRQSTSMTAEAGDQPADLEEVISPNPRDKRLTGLA